MVNTYPRGWSNKGQLQSVEILMGHSFARGSIWLEDIDRLFACRNADIHCTF
jgi:hypothetical protein